MTGSTLDELASLLHGRRPAFVASRAVDFPLLGRDPADGEVAYVDQNVRQARSLVPEEAWAVFEIVDHRPELLARR